MKFVSFDIECASVHKTYAKICVFGYVVCDENFNILEKEDILINPKGKFELTDRKGQRGIVLPYDYSEFKKHPSFPAAYKRIKNILEDKDSIVFGHAVLNDVKYLNLETKRFHLPSFKFNFADTQIIFMSLKNDFSHQYGLESIAEELNVEFIPHRAVDDAFATMRIMEAICRVKNCSYSELEKLMGFTRGKIENYNIIKPQTKRFKQYKAEVKAFKEARSRKRAKFYNNLNRKRAKKTGKLFGKVFTFSRNIEDETEISIPLVDKIYEMGGKYTKYVEECTHFVGESDDNTDRARKASLSDGIVMLNLEELRSMFNA